MRHLKIFEEFNPKQIVTYKGNVAEVISTDKDDVTINIFKLNKIVTVPKDRVISQIKCLSQCDKRVVGDGDNRYVKCFYCGKEQRFK